MLDGNLSTETLAFALDLATAAGARVLLEPVSVPKAAALAHLVDADRPRLGGDVSLGRKADGLT